MGCTPSSQSSSNQTGYKYGYARGSNGGAESPSWSPRGQSGEGGGEGGKNLVGKTPNLPHLLSSQLNNKDFADFLKNRETSLKLGPMCLTMPTVKVLLVFEKSDAQCDALKWAAERLHYQVTVVYTQEAALDSYIHSQHHLVILDARQPHTIDPLAICRSIRNIKGSQYTCLVAVVKKNWAEKEEAGVVSLLRVGFNRFKLKAVQALFAALDNCRDGVILTGPNHDIQFMNHGIEKLLGFRAEDMVGKNTSELHKTDVLKNDVFDNINAQINKGKEWEGTLYHRRKSGECIPLWSRIAPVEIHNGIPDHLVYIKEFPYYAAEKMFSPEGDILPYTYGSIKSNRKASCDVRSLCGEAGLNRRQSFAKLHAMTIEAPITKVINILMATQENSPVFVAQALEKVLDILRQTELYSPTLTGFNQQNRPDDQNTKQSGMRRMSHEAVTNKNSFGFSPPTPTALPNLTNMPPNIKNLLDSHLEWDMNIIELEQITSKRPLVWLGLSTLNSYNVCGTLNIEESTLRNWLTLIESNYRDNPYHNSTHAADVMQATSFFLKKPRVKTIFDPLDEAISLIAAIVHDIDHPGKNSAFLCNSNNDLAVLYNDISVLESHHAALAFKLTISDDSVNIFKNLDKETFREVRQSIIDMVLATEMTKHFEHLHKFVNVFTKSLSIDEGDPGPGSSETLLETVPESPNMSTLSSPENVVLIKRMLIKCADVSNPARPVKLCTVWANRIAEEYCNQTDEEKARGLPVVMPAFDRTTCSIPKSQMGFIDYFANDLFEAWDAFGDFPELIDCLRTNYIYWQEQESLRVAAKQQPQLPPVTSDQQQDKDIFHNSENT